MNEEIFDFGLSFDSAVRERRLAFTTKQKELLDHVVTEVRKKFSGRLLSVKLVGSRARGDHREISDWDILVFLSDGDIAIDGPIVKKMDKEIEAKFGLGAVSISPLSKPLYLNVEKKYPGIHENFRKDAINLYESCAPSNYRS